MERWYTIKNKADQTEILIYDQIGKSYWRDEGVGAKDFNTKLMDITTASILLRINSPGGNAFDGLAIYNALKAHKAKIHVKIDGLAASIASIIAMAGDTIEMPENAMLMIHKASGLALGNSKDMLDMADMLKKIDDNLAKIYATRSNLDQSRIDDMMEDETWLTAEEAFKYGLADTITERVNIQTLFTGDILNRFKNVPRQFKNSAITASVEKMVSQDPKARWERDEELRAEFGTFEAWQAYEEAVANGQVRVIGGKCPSYSAADA